MAEAQEDSAPTAPAKRSAAFPQSSFASLKRARKPPKQPHSPCALPPVYPRFELQHRKNAPLLSELRNLVLWMLTLEHGSTPQWIFTPVRAMQNKHEVRQLVLLFLPGLDAFTLRDHQETLPFLSSFLSQNKHFTLLRGLNEAQPGSYLRQIVELRKDLSADTDCFASIPALADPNGTL